MEGLVTAEGVAAAERQVFDVTEPYADLKDCKFDDIVPATDPDDAVLDYHVYEPIASAGIAPTYLKDYFAQSPGKPEIVLSVVTGEGSLYGTLISHITTASVYEASAYVYECLSLFKGTLREEWSSHNVQIGNGEEVVSPTTLVKIARDPALNQLECAPANDISISNRMYLLLWVLAPYRVHQGIRQEYTQILVTRISENLKEFDRPAMGDSSLISFVKQRPTWEQNHNYGRLVAALDMFLAKFPDNEYARVRICTVSARFKDCAALTGLEYLRGLLDITYGELMIWIWTTAVAKDLRQVFRAGEELTKVDSYLPYLASM